MIVSDGVSVIFDCTIKDSDAHILEDSKDKPAAYIHGLKSTLPAIEKALQGQKKGYSTTISLEPDDAFGNYDEDKVFCVPLNQFDGEEIYIGREFLPNKEMDQIIWRIENFDNETVTLNGNHSYAGKTLIFDMVILDTWEATASELELGLVNLDNYEQPL